MENTVRRRLDCISRHLTLHTSDTRLIRTNAVSSVQLKSLSPTPVVIGGMVLDIHAKPSTPAKPGTTTPGMITWVSGGVARNISECMLKLGTKPFMISVLGLDVPGQFLLNAWSSSGLSTEGIQKQEDITTPVVSNIIGADGELTAGVASVQAVEEKLTPEWIWQFRDTIRSSPVVMVDANMNPCSLEAACQIAEDAGIPAWFEPVSVKKSKRVVSIAKSITCTSPNLDELIAMANALSCRDEYFSIQNLQHIRQEGSLESMIQVLEPAICLLLEKGIKIVVLTLGSDGVLLCSRGGANFMRSAMRNPISNRYRSPLYKAVSSSCPLNKFHCAERFKQHNSHPYIVHFPALPASVVSVTGAGDCLVGGILASICSGLDIMQSVAVGIAAAKGAVEAVGNVPSEFCVKRVADDAKQVYFSAKEVLFHH
ncbi:pseudouridine kinase isoform X2 [Aristolochia californica]|uniref:pseudouridine kinase isoform X2 n=1 Tax=Aristolochia californica TaxID=171875 RepID=UPI0035D88C06